MSSLPAGTLTFLFADVEGSTRILRRLGEGYSALVADLRDLLGQTFESAGRS